MFDFKTQSLSKFYTSKLNVYRIIREHIYTIIYPDKTIKRGGSERGREPEIE